MNKTIKISFLILFLFCLIASPVFGAQLLYDPLDSADTVNANSGTMTGVSFAAGKKGTAAVINGYIDYPYSGKINANAGTIQFLVKPTDTGEMGLFESGMLGYANSIGIIRITMYGRTISAMEVRTNNSSYLQAWNDKDEKRLESNGEWYLVTAIWNCNKSSGDFFQLYINGVAGYRHSGSSVCTTMSTPSTQHLRIGSTYWYGNGEGSYDELKIFDYAKTQTEIVNDYKSYFGTVIACSKNSDCGTDNWIDTTTCSNNDVFQNYKTYACNSPGTASSSCTSTTIQKQKQDCGETSYGAWSANYCNASGNVEENRAVHNKGCSSGACTANDTNEKQTIQTCANGCTNGACIVPKCTKDSDCGTNGYINSPYCQNGNVFQNYQTFKCNNPTTAQANCTNTTTPQQKTGCVYGCTNGTCENQNIHIDWLEKNQDRFTTGLLESQVGFTDHRAFTYDLALAAIAFTKAGQSERAKKIFNKMKAAQNSQGFWYSAYWAETTSVWEWNIDTGPISWMVIAINYYESKTGDTSYSDMAEKAIGWLETRIDKNPSNGSYGALNLGQNFWNIPNSESLFGTEHQFDAYSAFKNRAALTTNATLKTRLQSEAAAILDYLVKQTWKTDHFERGYNDHETWLDCQTWASMALGHVGPQGQNFDSALAYANSTAGNMKKTVDYNSQVKGLTGFSYNNYQNVIWVEGTLQMADAYCLAGNTGYCDGIYQNIIKVLRGDGGLSYSFDGKGGAEDNWPDNLRYSAVSSSAWAYFTLQRFNPFQNHQATTCSVDSDCGTNGYINSPYCQNGNVFQDYKTFKCNNPSTAQSNCSSTTIAQLKQSCTNGCTNGTCNNQSGNDCNSSVPLYRFWNSLSGAHFYTIDEKEKNGLMTTHKEWSFIYEGIATYVYATQKNGTTPVYRFWNSKNTMHFYTISETEKNHILATWKEWIYEGIAAYIYPTQQTNTLPFYRFWNSKNNDHFYTTSDTEKNHILATWKEWIYEGITGYACKNQAG